MAAWTSVIAGACVVGAALGVASCDSAGAGAAVAGAPAPETEGPETTSATIGGERFRLELALDEQTRYKGLSGRTEIPRDGGMLFVFPDAQQRWFVMRDCPNPIDIAFLDGSGRVVAMHQMLPEEPRGAHESAAAYEQRLKRWPSRFQAQFAIETDGGRLTEVGLKVGEQVRFDVEGLKQRAR